MSHAVSAPATAPVPPPYRIPPPLLRAIALSLPRPVSGDPDDAWREVVQAALDQIAALDPRDALEAQLAVQFVAAEAGALDACRLAFEPDATAGQARGQRTNAAALSRIAAGAVRLLAQRRKQAVAPARDWGVTAADLGAVWREAPVRPAEAPRGGKTAEAEPEEIVRWLDETPDDELKIEVERLRRVAAGEPPLPVKPGPRVIYKYKPGDYGPTWKGPDPQNFVDYPGWENMTMAQRRAFFGYSYTGPGCPISMLSKESQAAHAARLAADEAERLEYGGAAATPET